MNRSGKKKGALLLAVSLLLGLLAGCGKKDNTQQLSANVYVPAYMDVGLTLDYVRGGCTDGEYLYILGQTSHEEEKTDPVTGESYTWYTYTEDIYRVDLESGAAERLPDYTAPAVPEGKDGSASIDQLAAGGDGTLWVTESVYVWGDLEMQEKYPDEVTPLVEPRAAEPEPEAPEEEEDESGGEDAADSEDVSDAISAGIEVDEPVEDSYSETVVRRHLDARGGELACVDISHLNDALADVLGEEEYIYSTSFDSEGNAYVVTNSKVYVLDPRMNILFTLEGSDMWYEAVQLNDGLMGIQKRWYDEDSSQSTNKLLTIDLAAKDWGPEYILPNNVYQIFPGGGDYLFYYQLNDGIFGYRAGEGSGGEAGGGERLFSWIEADIDNSDINSFFFLPDGRVAAIFQEWPEDAKGRGAIISIVTLTATPRDQLPEKTSLIYASLYLSYDARRKIIDFNKKSDKYRIEVKDYAEFDTDGTGKAALQKLNTEILAGNVPDILDTNNLPMRQYGAKGILEDLWPFIESDPDLGRDALMTRPLEANEQDGKLYEIFSAFSIQTAAGPSRIVGDSLSWTLADMKAALEKMPEGCSIMGQTDTQENMLRLLLSLNMDQFVDWDSGKCSFDSDEFKALLEFCSSFPAEWNWEEQGEDYEDQSSRVLNGRQLLVPEYLGDFQYSLQELEVLFNGEYAFVGYPKEDGSAGSSFAFYRGVAMTSSCADKEGAWSFIRQTLLPQLEEDQRYYGNFPINKADFDAMVAQSMEEQYETDENGDFILDEEGNRIPVYMGNIWISSDVQADIRPTTQEEVDRMMELYNAVDSVYTTDERIFDSVFEVASQYFAGDKPLDDAASLIQNKVNLYVNESK